MILIPARRPLTVVAKHRAVGRTFVEGSDRPFFTNIITETESQVLLFYECQWMLSIMWVIFSRTGQSCTVRRGPPPFGRAPKRGFHGQERILPLKVRESFVR